MRSHPELLQISRQHDKVGRLTQVEGFMIDGGPAGGLHAAAPAVGSQLSCSSGFIRINANEKLRQTGRPFSATTTPFAACFLAPERDEGLRTAQLPRSVILPSK